MRILLPVLLGLLMVPPICCCGTSQPILTQSYGEILPGYEVVIRSFETESMMDRVIDIFSRKGLLITNMLQIYSPAGVQELRINIKNGNSKQVDEAQLEVRSIMSVESILISKK